MSTQTVLPTILSQIRPRASKKLSACFAARAAKMTVVPPIASSAFVAPLSGQTIGVAFGNEGKEHLTSFVLNPEHTSSEEVPASYATSRLWSGDEGIFVTISVNGSSAAVLLNKCGVVRLCCTGNHGPQTHHMNVKPGDVIALISQCIDAHAVAQVAKSLSTLCVEAAAEDLVSLPEQPADVTIVYARVDSPQRTAALQPPPSSF
jgi:hypothetical protein